MGGAPVGGEELAELAGLRGCEDMSEAVQRQNGTFTTGKIEDSASAASCLFYN